jgi:hypothetical protein
MNVIFFYSARLLIVVRGLQGRAITAPSRLLHPPYAKTFTGKNIFSTRLAYRFHQE